MTGAGTGPEVDATPSAAAGLSISQAGRCEQMVYARGLVGQVFASLVAGDLLEPVQVVTTVSRILDPEPTLLPHTVSPLGFPASVGFALSLAFHRLIFLELRKWKGDRRRTGSVLLRTGPVGIDQ